MTLLALPFDEDREEMLAELGRANAALMLSWHEGFGLTGWEAIAGEVPLVVSRQSGLWKLLEETFGSGVANGLVRSVDVRGADGIDETTNFRPEDEKAVKDIILDLAANPDDARRAASELKQRLAEKLICTWENTARQFVEGLGVVGDDGVAPGTVSAPTGPAAASSDVISIPSIDWPTDFGGQMPASLMLRPESVVVPFHRSRHRLRDTIVSWALAPDRPLKLRLQIGEGGAGKTRLMIEVCERLQQAHGWRAGFLARGAASTADLQRLFREGQPCMIVLDYAETRADEIIKVAQTALRARGPATVRLALLARDGGEWWNRLADAPDAENATAALLRDPETTTGPHVMTGEAIAVADRAELFRDALACFAQALGREEPPVATADLSADLSADLFAKPLFIHLAALAALHDDAERATEGLLGTVLGHERTYWRQLLAEDGLSDDMLQALEQGVALLTLVGGARSAGDAKRLLARTPRLHGRPAEQRDRVFDTLRRLFALEGGLGGLEPDLLGETLIAAAAAHDDELLDAALGNDVPSAEARQALTVLTRLARRVPATRPILERALGRHLRLRADDARQVGEETGAPLPEILAEVLRQAPRQEQRQVVDRLKPKLPKESVNLGALTIEVARSLVAFAEKQTSGNPRKRDRRRFEVLSSLALALRKQGQHSEAAEIGAKALAAAQSAFRSTNQRDQSPLAGWLAEVAVLLRNVGRHEEALMQAEEAEALWRRLAATQPAAYRANWAASLSNLANHLRDVGRHEEALARAEAAEAILRELAATQPAAYRAEWAVSLGNLGNRLSYVGRHEEALARAETAEAIQRELAAAQPAAYRESWATSLTNSAARLRDVGRHEEALARAEAAEAIRQEQAAAQPAAYRANWATSLGNLASHLGDVGRPGEGLARAEAAEAILRELAEAQPAAYRADWATSLTNSAARLHDVGRHEEALARAEASEAILRKLAAAEPAAYRADWANSLGNLAEAEREAGKAEAAIVTAISAIELLETLAKAYPARHEPWLGFALRVSAQARLANGDVSGARDDAMRAVRIWEAVAITRPGFEAGQVAKALLARVQVAAATGNDAALAGSLQQVGALLAEPFARLGRVLRPVLMEICEAAGGLDAPVVIETLPPPMLAALRAGSDLTR